MEKILKLHKILEKQKPKIHLRTESLKLKDKEFLFICFEDEGTFNKRVKKFKKKKMDLRRRDESNIYYHPKMLRGSKCEIEEANTYQLGMILYQLTKGISSQDLVCKVVSDLDYEICDNLLKIIKNNHELTILKNYLIPLCINSQNCINGYINDIRKLCDAKDDIKHKEDNENKTNCY